MFYDSNDAFPTQQQEEEILGQIVDAMIEAQDQLDGASHAQWERILRNSCRQLKEQREQDDPSALLAVC